MRLAEHKCVPCKGGVPPLSPDESASLLTQLDGWQIADGKQLQKSYKVANFVDAMNFANAITPVAEAEGHHPDISVKWGELGVMLWTHSIGGLTHSDFYMAAKIDDVFTALQQGKK